MPSSPPHAGPSRPRTSDFLLAVGLVLLVLSLAIPLHGAWVIDVGSREKMARTIAAHHHFLGFSLPYRFRAEDPGFALTAARPPFMFVRGGELYASYAPTFPWIGAVAWSVMGEFGFRFIALGLGGVLMAWAGRALALRWSEWPGRHPEWASAVLLLASPLLPYAFTFWDVLPGIALATAALAFGGEGLAYGRPRLAAVGGAFAAAAFALREQALFWGIFAALLAPLAAPRRRHSMAAPLAFGAAFGLLSVPTLATNMLWCGHPLFTMTWAGEKAAGRAVLMDWQLSTRLQTAYFYLARVSGEPVLDWFLLGALAVGGVALGHGIFVRLAEGNREDNPTILSMGKLYIGLGIGLAASLAVRMFTWIDALPIGGPGQPLLTQFRGNSLATVAPWIFAGFAGLTGGAARQGIVGSATEGDTLAETNDDEASRGIRRWAFLTSAAFAVFTVFASPLFSALGFHFGPRLMLLALPPLALAGLSAISPLFEGNSIQTPGKGRQILMGGAVAWLCMGVLDNALHLYRLRVKTQLSSQTGDMLREISLGMEPSGGTSMPVATGSEERPIPVLTDMHWLALDAAAEATGADDDGVPLIGADPNQDMAAGVRLARGMDARRAWFMAEGEPPAGILAQAREVHEIATTFTVTIPDTLFSYRLYEIIWREP